MLIACDVDQTVADILTEWLALYNADWGDTLHLKQMVSYDIEDSIKPECGSQIFEYLRRPDFYHNVLPLPGALDGITRLREAGHDVVFVTACTHGGMADQKAAWLVNQGLCEPHGHMLPRDFIVIPAAQKARLLNADLLIEDHPDTLRAWVLTVRRRAILMTQPYNRSFYLPSMHDGEWNRVQDWADLITNMETLL